ncbi:MAG: winged helix DNA-binding domain-containing protein [bacterium]
MTGTARPLNIVGFRLTNQHLIKQSLANPSDVVRRLGAVQAQDYPAAKWGIALRTRGATDASIEQAINDGQIIRTHVLRPTWHFVVPADLRWMLELTAPRVRALSAYYDRQLELTAALLRRSNAALTKALLGGRSLTRAEATGVLERARIGATGTQRIGHLLMHAELDGVVCSGPRRGKQATYALLEERLPPANALRRDEALAELARRYFTTRGPATAHDFAWWSGLTVADATKGVRSIEPELEHVTIEKNVYWLSTGQRATKIPAPLAHLLPNYDEYFIGYKDRSAIGDAVSGTPLGNPNVVFARHVIIVNGRLVGGWTRTIKRDVVAVALNVVSPAREGERRAITAAARRYGKFLGLPVEIV